MLDRGKTLKVTSKDLGDRQIELTIEVDDKRVESALRVQAQRIAKQYNIPGFRRGRAPYHIILQRFGREALLQDALDDLGQEIYQEALKSEELEPYTVGSLENIQLDPLVLTMRVPLQPVVDLGDYRELRLEPPVVSVSEEQIADELEQLRQDNVILEPADERPAALGDMVILDVHAEMDGVSIVNDENHELLLDVGDSGFTSGLVEQIVGLTAGEEKSFVLALPDDEKQAAYSVTLHAVKSRILPELDDDLARTVGDFDTLAELRQDIHDKLQQQAQRQADNKYTEEVIEALVAQANVEYPPDLVKDQLDSVLEDMKNRLETQKVSWDDYLKLTSQTEDTFREANRPQAEKSARRGLVMSELARAEGLGLEAGEIDQRIADMAAALGGEQNPQLLQMLSAPENVRSMVNSLLTDKVIQRLLEIARGQAPLLEQEADEPEEESAQDEPEEAVAKEPEEKGAQDEPEEPVAKESVEDSQDKARASIEPEQTEAE
jgi:trigger factor